jgi:hypothetical protein
MTVILDDWPFPDPPPRVSMWKQATNVEELRCPCGAMNRPGVTYIELIDGKLFCRVCGKTTS